MELTFFQEIETHNPTAHVHQKIFALYGRSGIEMLRSTGITLHTKEKNKTGFIFKQCCITNAVSSVARGNMK